MINYRKIMNFIAENSQKVRFKGLLKIVWDKLTWSMDTVSRFKILLEDIDILIKPQGRCK